MKVACRHCRIVFDKKIAEIKRSPKHYCSKKCTGLGKIAENNKKLYEKCESNADGCMNWTGSLNLYGYGVTRYAGKIMLAHRASYLFSVGKINNNLCVLHTCDNPKCINPEHLWLGTHQDNMKDMTDKGRRYKNPPQTADLSDSTSQVGNDS